MVMKWIYWFVERVGLLWMVAGSLMVIGLLVLGMDDGIHRKEKKTGAMTALLLAKPVTTHSPHPSPSRVIS
jgi:hypothetical protein